MLKDYQQNRLLTFLDPGRDPLGDGYNLTQSIIAIGSEIGWAAGLALVRKVSCVFCQKASLISCSR